jgi:hypothetical protein
LQSRDPIADLLRDGLSLNRPQPWVLKTDDGAGYAWLTFVSSATRQALQYPRLTREKNAFEKKKKKKKNKEKR